MILRRLATGVIAKWFQEFCHVTPPHFVITPAASRRKILGKHFVMTLAASRRKHWVGQPPIPKDRMCKRHQSLSVTTSLHISQGKAGLLQNWGPFLVMTYTGSDCQQLLITELW